jgi:hypothetical protein
MQHAYRVGEPVIFVVSKSSQDPGPRAKHVYPAPAGETYSYQVEKFWTVADIRSDGHVVLVTRRGKQHDVEVADPRLRPARIWERWLYRQRFPSLDSVPEYAGSSSD